MEVGSPSFRLSQLADSSFVANICAPFVENEINNEAFCFTLLSTKVIPKLVQHIKEINLSSFEYIPQMSKLTIDNFGDEGLQLIVNKVLPEIQNSVRTSGEKYVPIYTKLYVDTLSSVSSKYRDQLVIDQIKKLSISSDVRDKLLATAAIPIVNNSNAVVNQFRALALDLVPQVRASVIDILPDCKFDRDLILYILLNGAKDSSELVKEHVAMVFAKVAPTYVNEYKELLNDETAGRYAVAGLAAIAKTNGISSIKEIFETAAERFPDDCVTAFLDICKIMKQDDEETVFGFAKLLIKNKNFVWHMHEFSEYFTNKEPFFDLLSPAKAKSWRLRFALQKQTLLFMPLFGIRLLNYAMRYSGDLVAIIRDGVVPIWVELSKIDDAAIEKLQWLSTKGFKQRLIVCKVITQIGISPKFDDIAEKFAHDKVSNVRYCLASRVVGTPLFNKYFADCQDPDILQLKEQNNKDSTNTQ